MATEIIKGLSNEDYHHAEEFASYISSTQLKWYLNSPLYFATNKASQSHESTDAMLLGSHFHHLMEVFAEKGMAGVLESMQGFDAPINPKTGKPYGSTTNAYLDALKEAEKEAGESGKIIVSHEDIKRLFSMVTSVAGGDDDNDTSRLVRKFIQWHKGIEDSFFYSGKDGVKLKVRPDLMTGEKIIDWKTTSVDNLNEKTIISIVSKYRYDISLSMYQWVIHEHLGHWLTPYLVVVQTQAPYDSVVVDLSAWCYQYSDSSDDSLAGPGAREFERLLDMHRKCLKTGDYKGICGAIEADSNGNKIMHLSVPVWMDREQF